MNETQVHIADEPGGDPPEGSAPQYQNLWVPLILVPAGIVMAIVMVVALFGNLAGDERSPAENLELVASGGKNERTQALMGLAQQAAENQRARNEERELPYAFPPTFGTRAMQVLDGLDEDDYLARFSLAAQLGGMAFPAEAGPRGIAELIALLGLEEGQDESGELRQYVLVNLGLLAAGTDTPADAATPVVLPFLEHNNVHLRSTAASVLAVLEGEGVREALAGALGDSNLSVRAAAAFTLSKLTPPGVAAAGELRALSSKDPYETANQQDRTLWTRAEAVSEMRIKALESLALLDREEDWAHIASLEADPDLNVRDRVLALLAQHEGEL